MSSATLSVLSGHIYSFKLKRPSKYNMIICTITGRHDSEYEMFYVIGGSEQPCCPWRTDCQKEPPYSAVPHPGPCV